MSFVVTLPVIESMAIAYGSLNNLERHSTTHAQVRRREEGKVYELGPTCNVLFLHHSLTDA